MSKTRRRCGKGRERNGIDVLKCGRREPRRRVLLAYQAGSDHAAYSAMAAGPCPERGLVATGRPGGARPARRPAGERHWRPEDPAPDLLSGVDALIHLAGASIGGRFTPARKAEIRDSRILPTRRLAELAAASQEAASQEAASREKATLKAFVTASAIGIYGPDRGDEVLTEDSPRGEGLLAD